MILDWYFWLASQRTDIPSFENNILDSFLMLLFYMPAF